MPRGRKRKDPAEAPIDGDYHFDHVENKQPGWTYKLLHRDDIPALRMKGYVREDRGPDAAHPTFDMGSDSDADYTVGNLTLWKAPDEVAARVDGVAQRRADIRMATIRSDAKKQGLKFETFTGTVEK